MNIVICNERQMYEGERPGNAEARETFLQEFPGVLNLGKQGIQFNRSGLFQIKGAVPFLVLPWFLNHKESVPGNGEIGTHESSSLLLLDIIRGIQHSAASLVDVATFDDFHAASEFLHHSFLVRLLRCVHEEMQKNYFSVRTEEISAIRGKWRLHHDLNRTARPLKFTCEYEETNPSNEILLFAKSVAYWVQRRVSNTTNSDLCNDIIAQLSCIDLVPLTEQVLIGAEIRADREPGKGHWKGLIAYGSSLYLGQENIGTDAGTAYQFPMDRFFELLVEDALLLSGNEVGAQAQTPVLGKSYWFSEEKIVEDVIDPDVIGENDQDVKGPLAAAVSSRPDLILKTQEAIAIVECKYKPLRVPFMEPNTKWERSLSREDRNQLLSFILSIESTPELVKCGVTINLVFPHIAADPFRYSDLKFVRSTLKFTVGHRHVLQSSKDLDPGLTPIIIRFVGVNVEELITIVERQSSGKTIAQLVTVLTDHSDPDQKK